MIILYYLIGSLFVVLGFACLILVVAQLPGTWIMLGLATLVHLADTLWVLPEVSGGTSPAWGWWAIGIGTALALVGELIEFAAGALGAKVGGGSKRSAWGAIIGGFIGAIGGSLIVPIIGTLVGAVVGCFFGALIGEMSGKEPSTAKESVKPAIGATIGRVLGTTCKVLIAVLVWVVLSIGLLAA
jgi:uncharacterized protein YqgC (DUF456 family)